MNLDYDFTPLRPTIPNLMHLGLEWSPLESLSLRMGIDQDVVGTGGANLNVANNLTCGLGLAYNGFRFDYAFHQYYAIADNDTHYFSLSYGMFNKPPAPPVKWVVHPADRTIVFDSDQVISGEVKDQAITQVSVSGRSVPLLDRNFTDKAALALGKNSVLIESFDKRDRPVVSQKIRLLRLPSFKDVGPENWARLPIGELAYLGVLTGYPDNTFQPDKTVSRAEFATLLVRSTATTMPQADQQAFRDVPIDHWAGGHIYAATLMSIVKGYPDNSFRPQGNITRAEGVAAIVRFAQLDVNQPIRENPFSDLPGRHWAAKEINAAKVAGYLQYIGNNPFEPNQPLTRGEVAEILSHTPPAQSKLIEILDFSKNY